MKDIFLLGNVYAWLTEEEIENKLNRVTEYERMKNVYLNEIYQNNDSKMTIWSLYHKNVLYFEKNLNKDLSKFDILELDSLISSVPSSSINIKANLFSFCNQYLEWCVNKRIISINNMSALDRDVYIMISQKLASSKLISYEQFWKLINYMLTKTDIQNVVPIVLSYYCINGKEMNWLRNLRWQDIDEENKVVTIMEDDKVVAVIPIDDNFISFCRASEEDVVFDDTYITTDLILKPTKSGIGDIVAENTLYVRIYQAFTEANVKRLKLNNLAKSRKIALLLEIRKERYLTNGDFQMICELFNPNASIGAYDNLTKYYINATNDKVLKKRATVEELTDNNIEEHMNEILTNLGWE